MRASSAERSSEVAKKEGKYATEAELQAADREKRLQQAQGYEWQDDPSVVFSRTRMAFFRILPQQS